MEREKQPEHEQQADRMEEDAERMEQHSEQLGERIDDIESDWARKEQDPAVPGAQPDPDEQESHDETPQESDQLPEEAPPEVVPDDDADAARPEARDSPGVPGDEETNTGNPDNAGADE